MGCPLSKTDSGMGGEMRDGGLPRRAQSLRHMLPVWSYRLLLHECRPMKCMTLYHALLRPCFTRFHGCRGGWNMEAVLFPQAGR